MSRRICDESGRLCLADDKRLHTVPGSIPRHALRQGASPDVTPVTYREFMGVLLRVLAVLGVIGLLIVSAGVGVLFLLVWVFAAAAFLG